MTQPNQRTSGEDNQLGAINEMTARQILLDNQVDRGMDPRSALEIVRDLGLLALQEQSPPTAPDRSLRSQNSRRMNMF